MQNHQNLQSINVIYDDGRFQVTAERLYTPTRFYPINNTTAKIRRDPFWFALALTAFSMLTTLIYSDLLYINEMIVIWGVTSTALVVGVSVASLSVDTVGHNNTMVVARTKTIFKLFLAMQRAKNKSRQSNIVAIEGSEND